MPRSDESKITPTGALIDPNGNRSQVLDEGEYRTLSEILDVMRDDNERPLSDAIDCLLNCGRGKRLDIKSVTALLVYRCAAETDQPSGFLISYPEKDFEHLTGDEFKDLQSMLKTHRYGGWFPAWLTLQVRSVADSVQPADRYPSPLDVMTNLNLSLAEFQESVDEAREMVQMRPDLFAPEQIQKVESSEAPAAGRSRKKTARAA
jgi:hypothetical protein